MTVQKMCEEMKKAKPYIYKINGELHRVESGRYCKCNSSEEVLYWHLVDEYEKVFCVNYETQDVGISKWEEWFRDAKDSWQGLADALREIEHLSFCSDQVDMRENSKCVCVLINDQLEEAERAFVERQMNNRKAIERVALSFDCYERGK